MLASSTEHERERDDQGKQEEGFVKRFCEHKKKKIRKHQFPGKRKKTAKRKWRTWMISYWGQRVELFIYEEKSPQQQSEYSSTKHLFTKLQRNLHSKQFEGHTTKDLHTLQTMWWCKLWKAVAESIWNLLGSWVWCNIINSCCTWA